MPVAVPAEQTARPAFPHSIVLIPARYESSRFPGKPLVPIAGRSMIEHVYRRARGSTCVSQVIVATDDARIARTVESFGGDVRLTSGRHRTGTDRLAEVAAALDCDLVVNVQGDEPLLDPRMIDTAIGPFRDDPTLQMSTVRRAIDDMRELADPNVVKVVVDQQGYALYFSRAAVPHLRDRLRSAPQAFRHIGLYVYRREFLVALAALPPTPLEQVEMLEQLRALEHGYRIRVVETPFDSIGVDTPEDLERVRALLERDARQPAHLG